jgi:DNA-binding transcriptional regulator GbsR (MarR family)
MDRVQGIFVDGIGAAAATSGVLSQAQGRIFGLLYLQPQPLSLDEIAAELEQSKSNVSIQIRGLVDWHLVRQTRIAGSRKDHYEAATDFWRVMQEIMERRFRWNLRQVVMAAEETRRAADGIYGGRAGDREKVAFIDERLAAMRAFFSAVDLGIGAFTQGKAITSETMQTAAASMVPRLQSVPRGKSRSRGT